jgi:acrylyl-CoA reductase (NADPH)
VNSVTAPKPLRMQAWDRLARDLDRGKLAAMTTTIPFERVVDAGRDILEGRVRGRLVVEIT